MVKNPPTIQETQVQSLGQEDPLEKEVEPHSSFLAWRIPWQRSLVGYSPGGRVRVGRDLATEQQQLDNLLQHRNHTMLIHKELPFFLFLQPFTVLSL